MKIRHLLAALAAFVLLSAPGIARAEAVAGSPAPDFVGTNADGNPVKLSDFKGKTVVLEWVNSQCPYVKKHYGAGNMQEVQRVARETYGAVWLAVASSAEGKEGYLTPAEMTAWIGESKANVDGVVMDASGEIGRAYGAKTTPHMFVIDPAGTVVYAGAIDDQPNTDAGTIAGAKNYVLAALEDLSKGRPVEKNTTQPYGCSVKY